MTRVALITGASRGIGAACAIALTRCCSTIFINYRSQQAQAEAVAHQIQALGATAQLLPFDVTDAAQVEAAMDQIEATAGQLDVLVNNAGVARDALLAQVEPDLLQLQIETNLKSVFYCCQFALPLIRESTSGRIINMSSVVGLTGNIGQTAYSATKAGVIAFTKSLALEVGRYGVTVNAVAPGFIETDMTAPLKERLRQKVLDLIPLKRFGQPEEVAHLVQFLASLESSYITGSVLCVTGGLPS